MEKFETLDDLPYHIKSDVEECLDHKKHNRNDWRGLASRLNIKATFIESLIKNPPESPCRKVFEKASSTTVTELLHALDIMERKDVLDIFYSQIGT